MSHANKTKKSVKHIKIIKVDMTDVFILKGNSTLKLIHY